MKTYDLNKTDRKLLDSINQKNLEGVKSSINEGADINCDGGMGGTPLGQAAIWKNLPILDEVLDHKNIIVIRGLK